MGKNNMNKEDKEENVAGFIAEGDLALCGQLVEVKTYLKPKNGESGEEQGSVLHSAVIVPRGLISQGGV